MVEKERQRSTKKPCTKCGVCVCKICKRIYTDRERNGGCHSFEYDNDNGGGGGGGGDDDDYDDVKKMRDIVRTRTNSNILYIHIIQIYTENSLQCLNL